MRRAEVITMINYGDVAIASSLVSLVREEGGTYDAVLNKQREAATDAVRAENDKLAAELDQRERANDGGRISMKLRPGLRGKDVDAFIARGSRLGDVGHRVVAYYLADCADRHLYQEWCFANVYEYAMKRHHI